MRRFMNAGTLCAPFACIFILLCGQPLPAQPKDKGVAKKPSLDQLAGVVNPHGDVIDCLKELKSLREQAGKSAGEFRKEQLRALKAQKKQIKTHASSSDKGTKALAAQLLDRVERDIAFLKAASEAEVGEYQRICIEAKQEQVKQRMKEAMKRLEDGRKHLPD